MKNENDNLEKALDNIFGSDELDINDGQQINDNNQLYKDKDDYSENKVTMTDYYKPSDEFKNVFDSNDDFFKNEEEQVSENNVDNFTTSLDGAVDDNHITNNKKNNLKMILFFVLSILGLALLVIAIFTFYIKNEKTVICSYKAEDIGYTITDRYEITYTNSKIKYINARYKYTVKTSDYKEQLKYIREEKLPVIINSNGMPGFTYLYDQSDDYFSVSSYLDFDLFDYEKIDKVDTKATPISYVTINSKTNLNSLTGELEEKGYTCEVE